MVKRRISTSINICWNPLEQRIKEGGKRMKEAMMLFYKRSTEPSNIQEYKKLGYGFKYVGPYKYIPILTMKIMSQLFLAFESWNSSYFSVTFFTVTKFFFNRIFSMLTSTINEFYLVFVCNVWCRWCQDEGGKRCIDVVIRSETMQ